MIAVATATLNASAELDKDVEREAAVTAVFAGGAIVAVITIARALGHHVALEQKCERFWNWSELFWNRLELFGTILMPFGTVLEPFAKLHD